MSPQKEWQGKQEREKKNKWRQKKKTKNIATKQKQKKNKKWKEKKKRRTAYTKRNTDLITEGICSHSITEFERIVIFNHTQCSNTQKKTKKNKDGFQLLFIPNFL